MQDLFLGCLHASRETCCWVSSCRPDWWPSNYLRTYMYVQLRYMYVFGYRGGGGVRYRRSSHKFFFFKSARLFGTNYVFNEPINAMDWAASEATMGNIPTYRPCSVLSFAQN